MDTSETALVIAGVAAIGALCYSTLQRPSYATQSTQCSARRAVSAKAARTSRANSRRNNSHNSAPHTQSDEGAPFTSAAIQRAVDANFNSHVSDEFRAQMKSVSFDPKLANKARATATLRKTQVPRWGKNVGHVVQIPGRAFAVPYRRVPNGDLLFNMPEAYSQAMKPDDCD
jgi:hypothetical protein